MNKLSKLYQRSSWFPVYNNLTTGGKARSNLLCAVIVQAIVSGFTGGIFYTGLLVGYGINIVNISILSAIPSVCSFLTIFSPLVLSKFKRRRIVLSVTRLFSYTVSILGITLLPKIIPSESGRIFGLIAISLITSCVNALFSPGYSPWHMSHITEDIRINYFSSTSLVSFISSSTVMLLASMATDRLTGDAQLNLIVALRYIGYAAAALDVYFLSKPKEPEYKVSTQKLSIVNVLKIPLSNRRFVLTILVSCMYSFIVCLSGSTLNTWLLEEVKASYLYVNAITAVYCFFIPATTPFWSKIMRKHGTFVTFAFVLLFNSPTYLIYAFVNHNNYLWLMTIVRLIQHLTGVGATLSSSNLIYVNLPEADQDSYIVFHSLVANIIGLLCTAASTTIVALMGTNTLPVLGASLSSVPILLIIQFVLGMLLPILIFAIRPWMDPTSPKQK